MENSRRGKIVVTIGQWLPRSVSWGGDWKQRDMRKLSRVLETLYIMTIFVKTHWTYLYHEKLEAMKINHCTDMNEFSKYNLKEIIIIIAGKFKNQCPKSRWWSPLGRGKKVTMGRQHECGGGAFSQEPAVVTSSCGRCVPECSFCDEILCCVFMILALSWWLWQLSGFWKGKKWGHD